MPVLRLANTITGAADASYEVERSRLPKPSAGCVLDKCSISGGKFVTAGLSFAIGSRDKSVLITRQGYIRGLKWIAKQFVVFWDEGEKRGWLVNGTSALLHLVRASLQHDKQSKFKSACVFNPDDLVEAQMTHLPDSALEVLLNKKNRTLKIYSDEEDSDDEEGPSKDKGKKYYSFQDRVKELFETLEKIIHYEIGAAEESGVKLKARARKVLEGWDFQDIITDNDPFYPRVATLLANGKGWVDLIRNIHATALLGKGFGDIIRPTPNSGTCVYWATVPQGQYYLAAHIEDLKEIAELHGEPNLTPIRLGDNVIWHNLSPDRCCCQNISLSGLRKPQKKNGTVKHSEFAQVLLPITSVSMKKKCRPVGPFKAFVFGLNRNFPSAGADSGNPEIALDTPEQSEKALSDRPSSAVIPTASITTGTSPSGSSEDEEPNASLAKRLYIHDNAPLSRFLEQKKPILA